MNLNTTYNCYWSVVHRICNYNYKCLVSASTGSAPTGSAPTGSAPG